MDQLKLETTYIPHLRGQFRVGSTVLFLGAGFSLEARNHSGQLLPSTKQLTKKLWALCYSDEPFDDTTQLQDMFDMALSANRTKLAELMKTTFSVDPGACPEWYRRFLMMPWLRIYTLNVDNLVQQVLSPELTSRQLQTLSAAGDSGPVFQDSALTTVHLNGTLDDIPDRVTFSRAQYAQRPSSDSAYTQLRNDLLCRPVIFVGASLEEGPLWEHIEIRGVRQPRGQRELRPRSYLVVPDLNRPKQALLSRHNVAWLPMSAKSFCESILSTMEEERCAGHKALAQLAKTQNGPTREFNRVADIAADDKATDEYLLGAEPTWEDVKSGRVADRRCFDEMWDMMNEIRANTSGRQALVVTGTAGTGKSSAIMLAALRFEADGVSVAWADASHQYSRTEFRRALDSGESYGALFINDADLYEGRLSSMIVEALEMNPNLLMVCEMRSSKVDRSIRAHELGTYEVLEYTVPGLGDKDIDAILDVLDRENRLGMLKGKSRDERRRIFHGQAGRQLLVAMHFATHGQDFEEKAKDELRQMTGPQKFLYGLICVASSHRFSLRQDDVGIAWGDSDTKWLQTVNLMVRRKLILPTRDGGFRARHRMIAQFVYDSLVEEGRMPDIVSALIRIGATKTTSLTPRNSGHARLLRTCINHNFMLRTVDLTQARLIYSDFEDALSWNYHYWLHRGALELETDNLGLAENFLSQAKSINERDVFIDNELAYLSFKKANQSPTKQESPELVQEAIEMLVQVAHRRPDQIGHAYHIMGQQGLVWAKNGISTLSEKRVFLESLEKKVKQAVDATKAEMMATLHQDIQQALLMLAVRQNEDGGASN